MLPILIPTAVLLLASLATVVLVWLVQRLRGGGGRTFWRRAGLVLVGLVPLHLLVTTPLVLGWAGSRLVHTRGDESAYGGPRLDASGTWIAQSRASLRAEADGNRVPDPALVAAASHCTVTLTSDDGTPLRAFLVPPRGQPRCTALLVHGLFRGGLELEPVGHMLRDLGAEVMLLELRNHGGSGRAPATFGRDEAGDVVAAAHWLLRDPARHRRPLILFGVSLGTAAVALASQQLPEVDGIALDAPIDDLLATAHRTLGSGPHLRIPQPFRSLILTALELWSGFRFAAVRPGDALRALPPRVAVLLVGGGADHRVPPAAVRKLFGDLRATPDRAELWIHEGSKHGHVWIDDPAGYRQRLQRLLQRAGAG